MSRETPPPLISAEDLAALLAERDALRQELKVTRVERDLLKEQLKAHTQRMFGARSEARSTAQRDLFLNEAEALAEELASTEPAAEDAPADSTTVAAHARKNAGRKPLDSALPREVLRHELPESERICPHDGTTLVEIGVEVSEQLDIIPQQVRVLRHERVKYACACCDQTIKVTPAIPRVIPRGLFTPAALAWVITAKYMDGLPLYRIAALLKRFGGDISRNTLAASVVRIGQAIQPVINLLRDQLLDSDLAFGDETTVQVLKEPGRPAQSKSFMWVQMNGSGPPVRLFSYAPGRSTQHGAEIWAGMRRGAVLVTDGYGPYNTIAQVNGLEHLGCWAHARRYFFEAERLLPKTAHGTQPLPTRFIALIGKLYGAESRTQAAPARRARIRRRYSARILAQIRSLLDDTLAQVAPSGKLGEALQYLAGQWPKLTRYVENGTWPIDNNECENAIRPFVIGRKAWLFCDTVAGAKASANLYSLIETAKANSIDPFRYLDDLLHALPSADLSGDFEALMPWRLGRPIQSA